MLYFCHVCEEQTEVLVDHQPVCLICQSEFVEEIDSIQNDSSFGVWYQQQPQSDHEVGGSWPESSSTIESEYDAYDYPGLCSGANSDPDPDPDPYADDDDQDTQYSTEDNDGTYFNNYDGESDDGSNDDVYDPYRDDYDGYASFHEEDHQGYGSTDEEVDIMTSQLETDEPTSERSWYTYYEGDSQIGYNSSLQPTSDHYLYDPYIEDEFPDADSYATPEEDAGSDENENHPADFVSESTNEDDTDEDDEDDPSYFGDHDYDADDTTDLAQLLENAHISDEGEEPEPEHYYDPEEEDWAEGYIQNIPHYDPEVEDWAEEVHAIPHHVEDWEEEVNAIPHHVEDWEEDLYAARPVEDWEEDLYAARPVEDWEEHLYAAPLRDSEAEYWEAQIYDASRDDPDAASWAEQHDAQDGWGGFQEAYDIPNILRMINEEHQNDPSWESPAENGASPADIELLPQRRLYDGDDKEVIESECSICQDVFGTELYLTRLPCQHEYHAFCIEQWLLRNATCPICRSQAITWNSSTC